MTELALPALVAMPLLVELAQHRLRVHAKWNLLDLDRLEELGGFLGCLFCCLLFLLTLQLLCRFLLFRRRTCSGRGLFYLPNLFLCSTSFFL
jgi:hypothetical protein